MIFSGSMAGKSTTTTPSQATQIISTVHGAHVETRPGFKWQWWSNSPRFAASICKVRTPKLRSWAHALCRWASPTTVVDASGTATRAPGVNKANWRQEHKRQDLQDLEVQDYRHLHGCKKSCCDTHSYIDNLKCQRTANLKCFHSQSFTHLSRTNGFHFKRAINVHILLGVCVHTFTNKDTSKRGCFYNTTRSMQNPQNLHICPNP